MKQWQISLDPMPSRISRPVRSRQRSQTLDGRASPALAQVRTLEKSGFGAAVHRGEHPGIRRRYAEKERRAVPADLVEDRLRRRPPGKEHGRRSDVVRKILSVAEPVGEEEPGDREATVGRPDAEDVLGVGATADPRVVLEVDDALRLPRRPARVEHERRAVAVCAGVARPRIRRAETVGRLGDGPGLRVLRQARVGRARRVEDEEPRLAVVEDFFQVRGRQLRVERDRDGARGDRAPEDDREHGPIRKKEGDSVPGMDPLAPEGRGKTPHAVVELGVAHLPRIRDDGHALTAALRDMPPHEPMRRVEAVREVVGGAHGAP